MTAQQTHIPEHNTPHTQSAVERTGAHYSAKQLAEELETVSSTLRTRWFPWLKKVAPEQLLKTDQGYTELARALFFEFKTVDTKERDAWVVDAKHRYSQEWESAGVIEGELMPEEVGGVLAILSSQNTSSEIALQQELDDLDEFIHSLNQAESNFSDAEVARFRLNGAQRGVARFKIEAKAEAEVYNRLQQKRLEK
ncbi:hypothetical protein U2F10_05320 [Leptothoe sp. EHU-05/26/07-4]